MADEDAHLESLPLIGGGKTDAWNLRSSFAVPMGAFAAALLVLFSIFVEYSTNNASDEAVMRHYTWYIHVAIMIFVGFGFLMTFLKRYSNSAVALNFFTSCLVMLEFIIVGGAVQQIVWGTSSRVQLDLPLLIDAAFAAGAAMISFGAVLGRTSPAQTTWLLVLQVPIYAVNQHLVFNTFKALDVGGSISIHAFGAFYGLAASTVLPRAPARAPKNAASWNSDMTAMIGTIFLWIYWPSFNAALASDPFNPSSVAQFHCIANTVVALVGACIAAFVASSLFCNQFDMVHIQNATLAGGVAVGSMANMIIAPGGALGLGMLAGVWSVVGYVYISSALEKHLGLQDTCGVHNLHGMPGVLGGLAAAVASVWAYHPNEALLTHGRRQWSYQLLALLVTLVLAIGGGLLAGLAVSKPNPFKQSLTTEMMYDDGPFWAEKAEEEE